ncbi:hypothetical protein [Secundilactobacillus similis]|uniref:hypothetical protein n=1 Tax=Secundilactobacillus similis TaxID=414682 RepID=UPI000AF0C988|nr:hypothetical protein [Secundilactobacillus similis]
MKNVLVELFVLLLTILLFLIGMTQFNQPNHPKHQRLSVMSTSLVLHTISLNNRNTSKVMTF